MINRAWKLCSTYELVNKEFSFLKNILEANGYPSSFIDKCIKQFLSRQYDKSRSSEKVFGPEKKRVVLCLPFCGLNSTKIKRQLSRLVGAVIPSVELLIIFKPIMKLSILSKLKSSLPTLSRSNVIYKVHCNDCEEFYVGKTKRILKQRILEHSTDEHSALFRHSVDTKHCIAYDNPAIITSDTDEQRLYVKETLKIVEMSANKSLNGNLGSFDLKLW